jgi:hypothetical protein
MTRVVSFQFRGRCASCPRYMDGNAAVLCDVDDHEVWVCARCARNIARRLLRAADTAQRKTRAGFVYRHDRWQKAARPGEARP